MIVLMPSFPDDNSRDRIPTVLFFDSGVGGLAYLDGFFRHNPGVRTAYFADTAFFPYGERNPQQVEERVLRCFSSLPEEFRPDLAVLACNTASVVALSSLRNLVDYPIVGVVPAVKPAAALSRNGHIAILSTNRTANDPYTRDLVRRFARYSRVHAIGLPQLVERAEQEFCSGASLVQEIREAILPILPVSVDTVVLACTHFVRYRRSFERVLGTRAAVVDSLDGVIRRIESLLREAGFDGRSDARDILPQFFCTAPLDSSFPCINERFDLQTIMVSGR